MGRRERPKAARTVHPQSRWVPDSFGVHRAERGEFRGRRRDKEEK
jgi:hypothetical protein